MHVRYLVLTPFVFSGVSPSRNAINDDVKPPLAISIMVSHCSEFAKFGKYRARGFQLKIYGTQTYK